MLIDSMTTVWDEKLGRREPVFPRGWSDTFTSLMPSLEVLKNTPLDPQLGAAASTLSQVGPTLAAAVMGDRLSVDRMVSFVIGSTSGFVAPAAPKAIFQTFLPGIQTAIAAISSQVSDGKSSENLLADILIAAGWQAGEALGGVFPFLAPVVGLARGISSAVKAADESELARKFWLPWSSTSPETDAYTVREVQMAVARGNPTAVFMPRTQGEWYLSPRDGNGVKGYAFARGGSDGFWPGGGAGCLFGLDRVDAVTEVRFPLLWDSGYGDTRRLWERTRCNYAKRSCDKTRAGFKGTKDCRQCVNPYQPSGVPSDLVYNRPQASNSGSKYPSLAGYGASIRAMAMKLGPFALAIDVAALRSAWSEYGESRTDSLRYYWRKYHGQAHRLVIAQIMSRDISPGLSRGRIGDWSDISSMPAVLSLPTLDAAFATVGLNLATDTVYMRDIPRALDDLEKLQKVAVGTTVVACVRPAFVAPPLRVHVDASFRNLVQTPSAWGWIPWPDVVDKDRREALTDAGAWPLNVKMGPPLVKASLPTVKGTTIGDTGVVALRDNMKVPPPARAMMPRPFEPLAMTKPVSRIAVVATAAPAIAVTAYFARLAARRVLR
jgi:hypothetical protein